MTKELIENLDSNIQSEETSKILTDFNEAYYFDFITFKQKPVDKNTILLLGQEFIKWAEKKGIKVSQFWKKKGISRQTLSLWRKRHPEFDELYIYGKELIGDRREEGGMYKKYSEKMVMYRMHDYDSEWAASDQHHAKLRKEEDKTQTFTPPTEDELKF